MSTSWPDPGRDGGDDQLIVQPFPAPPMVVARMLTTLTTARHLATQVAQGGPGADLALQQLDSLGDLDALPRPWEPASCPTHTRKALWQWIDEAASWINHEHGWAVARTIPGCWPQHPHLAHELAVLVVLRWQAHLSLTPDPLEEWHRWTLPTFHDRLRQQIGANGCPPGKHQDWPSSSRQASFGECYSERLAVFDKDARSRRSLG